jgi:hypothetical protein
VNHSDFIEVVMIFCFADNLCLKSEAAERCRTERELTSAVYFKKSSEIFDRKQAALRLCESSGQ